MVALCNALSLGIAPASAFCHIKKPKLSVMVPSPSSVKECGWAAGSVAAIAAAWAKGGLYRASP